VTPRGRTTRAIRSDDALVESLARREEPPVAGTDRAARLLADIAVAADAATPGLAPSADLAGSASGVRAYVHSAPERGERPSLGWAVAAAAAAVLAVGLGTIAPRSAPGPVTPVSTVDVTSVSLARARTLIGEAEDILAPAGALLTPAARDRARGLLVQARTELALARKGQQGQSAEGDAVEKALVRAETELTESARGLEPETSRPTPTPTVDEEQHTETDEEPSAGDGSEKSTPEPSGNEESSHTD
jgi:hypothetical protein